MIAPHFAENRFILDAVFGTDRCADAQAAGLDWSYIGDIAVRHGVAPLLYERLQDFPGLPESARARWRACYYAAATQNMHQFEAATRVVERLNELGIQAICLKGASLAEPVYGNIALRPCEDVDVLIRRQDYGAARGVLEDMGFAAPDYLWPDTFYLEQHFHLPFVREHPVRVYLELHWDFTDRYLLYTPDMDAVWARAGRHRLQADDEWIYLAMHVAKHGAFNAAYHAERWPDVETFFFDPVTDNRLIWMVDLWRLLKQEPTPLDWEQMAERARAWGAARAVVSAEALLEALSGSRVPVPAALQSSTGISRTERWLYRSLVRPGAPPRHRWLLKMNTRLQFRPVRLLDIGRYLFPPKDYLGRRYGSRGRLSRRAARAYHLGQCLMRHVVRPVKTLFVATCSRWLRLFACRKKAFQ